MHPLFEDVQMSRIFEDGKTFVDCVPAAPPTFILQQYAAEKQKTNFSLQQFVEKYFVLPKQNVTGEHETQTEIVAHIDALWYELTRQPDLAQKGSLLPLPNAYVVPGGRFREVYYWDSYFTMLGLRESGRIDLLENMVNNFTHLIRTIGFIPNGNRTYYLGRSQPPFYSFMLQLLAEVKGEAILVQYKDALEKEYAFWMKGNELLSTTHRFEKHVVLMKDGEVLNRYCDAYTTARPESYREDVELTHAATQPADTLYAHLRAGAESGWDYSCRWFSNINDFSTIHTTEIIPVDLNCLLFNLEQLLAKVNSMSNDETNAGLFAIAAEKRKKAILKYCWNESLQLFTDYDTVTNSCTSVQSLATATLLFVGIATQQQADAVAAALQQLFLKDGGLLTTLYETGQQWDAPNGWAPLQWMSIVGLENYGHQLLAADVAKRWIKLNKDVFARTGKLMEKYNVVNTQLEAGGGEYAGQDGFGWTNGVLLALMKKYE
ncbi:alpha,alpha-trehalase TreF [Lacibacter luteus]|uniref:Alpha,alpha-trehalase TreF n=1 Tax=Lacibacter luteus TaxID=2508719 RepID=A0A4Q1CKS2_9BACT|nr:alpha,alpha-trehalase TreF [Lacibacter luteus]RXK60882.1 alpha,alpha-trehalase TreF [Lacibacter luteus]